jgi:hypothetical protein
MILDEFYNKHYVRLDTENRVIKGFSDAFEQPTDGDICINEQGGRHFEISGVINPPLINEAGIYLYKYVDGTVLERTADEIKANIKETTQEPTINERVSAIEDAMIILL